ncbi:MAG: M61 family metallopeptidase [Bacteroidia bacterium]
MAQLQYTVSYRSPNRQLIDIELHVQNVSEETLEIHLPNWRPGRYEMGNFARNIRAFGVFDADNQPLPFEKTTKNVWNVTCKGTNELYIRYDYYAAELNAGSTWLDDEQLYVNPVNCMVFLPNRMNEACMLNLQVPHDYKVAIDLPAANAPFSFMADSYDRLADAPFIASRELKHHQFEESNHTFHLWFMGRANPPFDKLEEDFRKFCREQIQIMGALPGPAYHFIFQILPIPWYHGVEHTYSTVCALGPGQSVFEGKGYEDLLGVSSHELFHAWNIKTIRPSDMAPYDFDRENYSRLGWIYEGITTYYGDQFLIRSGVFSPEQFLITLNEKLFRHFSSYGRLNQAVADASFDTWLDGYVPGIPHRKTSIYTEGSLIAFILDMKIRQANANEKSLDDFMLLLKNDKTYTKKSVVQHLVALGFADAEDFYTHYIEKAGDLEPLLGDYFNKLGLQLEKHQPYSEAEHIWGFTLIEQGSNWQVGLVAPESPAEKAGLSKGDVLLAAQGVRLNKQAAKQLFVNDNLDLHFFRSEQLKHVRLTADGNYYFESRKVSLSSNADQNQLNALKKWAVNL